ncbi:MAG: hypothetical protein BKP49_06765 [Treponema sp. CETP13]|nr:MAG: hypothetical protein BKP49_06765 [Treponema sp. CETP13]
MEEGSSTTENNDTKNTAPLVNIISPVSGTWANIQPLVLERDDNTDVYYSFNGDDPLKSGFVYDGSVRINLDGDVMVRITAVRDDAMESYTVTYSVNKQEDLSFVPEENIHAYIEVNSEKGINIPSSYEYSLGVSDIHNSGRNLKFTKPVVIERLIPLKIYTKNGIFRYILKTGDINARSKLEKAQNDVTFTDWNYLEFKNGKPIIYSVDNGTLMESKSGHITIDRSVDHTIIWYEKDDYDPKAKEKNLGKTLFVPAKTELVGYPKDLASSDLVNLKPKNAEYILGFIAENGEQIYCKELTVDTLFGDALGFNKEISFYYQGVKQGSVVVTFVVDKILPDKPEFITSAKQFYSREKVVLDFDTDYSIYYAIADSYTSKDGFYLNSDNTDRFPMPQVKEDDYILFSGDPVVLECPDYIARLFTVYAYAQDFAGNKSPIVSYRVVVDTANYYISKDTELTDVKDSTNDVELKSNNLSEVNVSVIPDGTAMHPYKNLDSLQKFVTAKSKKIVHITGSFTSLPTYDVTADLEIIGDGNTELNFAPGCGINIINGSVYICGCTVKYMNYTSEDRYQNYLFNALNSKLLLIDCEIVSRPGKSGTAIKLTNSSMSAANTGITVQAISYVSAISADNSELILKGIRAVVVGQTAVAISLNKGIGSLDSSTFNVLSDLPRAVELTESSAVLKNSSYVSTKCMEDVPAIWLDSKSKIFINENNTISGFSTLLVE